MNIDPMPYEKQIFVCTNESDTSCGKDTIGLKIFKELRAIAKEKGCHPRIRIAQAKCLGQCEKGCNIMSYPDNTWYSGVSLDDLDQLAVKFFD